MSQQDIDDTSAEVGHYTDRRREAESSCGGDRPRSQRRVDEYRWPQAEGRQRRAQKTRDTAQMAMVLVRVQCRCGARRHGYRCRCGTSGIIQVTQAQHTATVAQNRGVAQVARARHSALQKGIRSRTGAWYR